MSHAPSSARPVASRAVCVYCASSKSCDPVYHDSARDLGWELATRGWTVVYGGGRVGSMGALAAGALGAGGHVIGVIPRFMQDLEWGHGGLAELHVVEDMRTRKHEMLARAQAVIALPGGTGTFEELLEALTLKRLGLFLGPIVLVNTRNFYAPLLELLDAAIAERFMDERHRDMWTIVDDAAAACEALDTAPRWSEAARSFAAV